MRGSIYFNHKLEKIQFAIQELRTARIIGIEKVLNKLEIDEVRATQDLIEAEEGENEK